jgi:hypothetical protein
MELRESIPSSFPNTLTATPHTPPKLTASYYQLYSVHLSRLLTSTNQSHSCQVVHLFLPISSVEANACKQEKMWNQQSEVRKLMTSPQPTATSSPCKYLVSAYQTSYLNSPSDPEGYVTPANVMRPCLSPSTCQKTCSLPTGNIFRGTFRFHITTRRSSTPLIDDAY